VAGFQITNYKFQILNPRPMARKKKPDKFSATTTVKSMAREAIGAPPPVRKKESAKRLNKAKHKPTLGKMLSDAE
jgi:hypothetical protein